MPSSKGSCPDQNDLGSESGPKSAAGRTGTRFRGALIKLAILGIACALSLALGEVAARLIYSDISTTARHSDYFSQRWYARHPFNRNSLGYREREFSPTPEDGVYRIAVLGDSITFGQGLRDDARMTNQLESRLNASGRSYEVLNFGRPGAETVHQLDRLKSHVLPVKPDVILLQWFVNDVEGRNKGGRPPRLRLIPIDSIHSIFWRRSALYVVAQLGFDQLVQSFRSGPSYAEYMANRFGDPESEDAKAYDKLFETLIETAKAGSGDMSEAPKVGLYLYPRLPDYQNGRYALAFLHERVMATCTRLEIQCLDLSKTLFSVENRSSLAVNRLDAHPSAKANEILTDAILGTFAKSWPEPAEPAAAD